MHEGFKIDKDLPSKLDILLKEGCLDTETEILRILETLSEKLDSLENKEEDSTNQENELEKRNNRIHQKWEKIHLTKKNRATLPSSIWALNKSDLFLKLIHSCLLFAESAVIFSCCKFFYFG